MKNQIFQAGRLVATEEAIVRTDGSVVIERTTEDGSVTELAPTEDQEVTVCRSDALAALTALASDAAGQRVLSALVALELVAPRLARRAGWLPPMRMRTR